MKAAILARLKTAALAGDCRLIYFDEAGFSASPPVQYGWSPRGEPHRVEPRPHCKRSVLGALDLAANTLQYIATAERVTRSTVVQFLDQVAQQGDGRVTFVVLDNARIHHGIEQATLDRWLVQHRMVLFYLPTYSPELNLIEMVWKHAKYHWRRFITWTRETLDAEISALLGGYGDKFQINFS
ncbi:IS630 family transposase [Chromobacterium phragmitis]|nr:IS630 family transposase [Chromobacterium amazonense]MBM2886806.1 IS630 family transposase [Chromobacterium amazonense]